MSGTERFNEVVHDMRNQLTVARANVEAFIDGKVEPTAARFQAVLQSLTQLEGLLNDLNAREATIEPQVRSIEIDVCELLNREYKAIEAVAREKKVSLFVNLCPVKSEACGHFMGDPVRIGQIVSNVMLNAVRYTPPGGEVRVNCSREADQLEISIADSGPGVGRDEMEKIFEPGVRGAASLGTPGSGLGLAIAKEFVEAQGGTIVVSPTDASGARFVVRLPGTVFSSGRRSAACQRCSVARGLTD
jgi:two-component system sensor histidine kinase BaeS